MANESPHRHYDHKTDLTHGIWVPRQSRHPRAHVAVPYCKLSAYFGGRMKRNCPHCTAMGTHKFGHTDINLHPNPAAPSTQVSRDSQTLPRHSKSVPQNPIPESRSSSLDPSPIWTQSERNPILQVLDEKPGVKNRGSHFCRSCVPVGLLLLASLRRPQRPCCLLADIDLSKSQPEIPDGSDCCTK